MVETLLLLVATPSVALHVHETVGIEPSTVDRLVREVRYAIEQHTGGGSVLDAESLTGCSPLSRCFLDVTRRTGLENVVLLRFYGAPTRLRVIAERFDPEANMARTAQTDLPKDAVGSEGALRDIVPTLFPTPLKDPLPQVVEPEPRTVVSSTEETGGVSEYGPWVVIGASAIALAVGIGFGVSSRNASDSIASLPPGEEVTELSHRANQHGTIANILFASSAVGAVIGLTWMAL